MKRVTSNKINEEKRKTRNVTDPVFAPKKVRIDHKTKRQSEKTTKNDENSEHTHEEIEQKTMPSMHRKNRSEMPPKIKFAAKTFDARREETEGDMTRKSQAPTSQKDTQAETNFENTP